MMRVLFVCDHFWPFIGGAEISSLITCQKLSEIGWDIYVLTHRFPKVSADGSYSNIRIFRERLFSIGVSARTSNIFQRMLFYLRAALLTIKYIPKTRPTVLLTQQLIAIPTTLIARLFRIPVIVIVRDYWPVCYYRTLLKPNLEMCVTYDNYFREIFTCAKNSMKQHLKKLKSIGSAFAVPYSFLMFAHSLLAKYVIKKANGVIVVSNFLKNVLCHNGFDPRKIRVIYNPIIGMAKGKCGCAEQRSPSILFVGLLDLKKGVQYLIKAMPQVRAKAKKAELIIVGDGPHKTYFQALVKELHIDNCTKFLGQIPDDQLISLYKSCSVVVVPSIWPEPFGRVVAEALFYNKPVVASNIGGIPELVRRNTGILVPPGNEEALADAIVSFITNKELLEVDSFHHRRFSPKKIVRQYKTFIELTARMRYKRDADQRIEWEGKS